jgi:prepilin-type N-terminal cleavage/methylation domain-containing protein
MTASLTERTDSPMPRPTSNVAQRGFTLTEMLVVIGIIALLIGILLPALSRVQDRARRTQTESLMNEFRSACENFQQQFGFYPGIVPEAILNATANPAISGMENALLHMCGGAIAQDDPDYGAAAYASWTEVTFGSGTNTFRIKVNASKVGEGPRIQGAKYSSFFSPKTDDLLAAPGQNLASAASVDPYANDPLRIPDLLDSWGQPIMYFRQLRPQAQFLVQGGLQTESLSDAMFAFQGAAPYLNSAALGDLGRDQSNSVLRLAAAANRSATLAQIIRAPAIGVPTGSASQILTTAAPRGAFAVISAGKDGVFYSQFDGIGSPSAPKSDIISGGSNPKGPEAMAEYDDIRVFGGG